MQEKLIKDEQLPNQTPQLKNVPSIVRGIQWNDIEYKQTNGQPKFEYTTLTLLCVVSLLIVVHMNIIKLLQFPVLQYLFITLLFSFIFNYTSIIRKYELRPFLPDGKNDDRLKLSCGMIFIGIVSSIFIGWNGSGGILFAIIWQNYRGSKMGLYKYFFAAIIIGSILLQKNYTMTKMLQFIPGVLFGFVNTEISKLRTSNQYSIVHEISFCCSMLLPFLFSASSKQSITFINGLILIICSLLMLFTLTLIVKLMQNGRVSVVTGVLSGILMLASSSYLSFIDYFSCLLIFGGIGFLIKYEYIDIQS